MVKASEKITLNTGREIPFNKLVLSQRNVRKTKAGMSIADLAEDIARRGLLTSLNVRVEHDAQGRETGFYRIPAGGRRYRALELLVSQGRLSRTVAVPCILSKSATDEVEDSLAENTQRLDLHPLDQFRAIMTLWEEGVGEEEIAARFFISVATVRQRLRLASVSPRLLERYAADEMTLQQVMAFSITDDRARQEQVWELISRQPSREPYYIRRLLTETTVRATDRRAVYVGIAAYEAAGGIVMHDLFDDDNGGWLEDPSLLEQLAIEKLRADADALKTDEGWKWVEAAFDFPYGHTAGLRRFYPERVELTDDELDRRQEVETQYKTLDAGYAEATEYDPDLEQRLEELGGELDRLNNRPLVFDRQEVARGGAFISLGADGIPKIERGFVRPEDEPAGTAEGDDASDRNEEDDGEGDGAPSTTEGARSSAEANTVDGADEEDGTARGLSDRVVEDLTAARTLALRNALANDPAIAFVAALHALVLRTFFSQGSASCLELTFQSANLGQTPGLCDTVWAKEIDRRHEAWGQDLPRNASALWDYLISLDEVRRQALFAHCISLSLNAVVQAWNRRPAALLHAEQLARSLGFDMAEAGWEPTVDNYLGRITKAHILKAVREARGEPQVQLIDHLKKPDMAREAERLLRRRKWLPEPLRASAPEVSPEEAAARAVAADANAGGYTSSTTDEDAGTGAPRSPVQEPDAGDPAFRLVEDEGASVSATG